eukprot:TRINITY_DN754_c0_g1_i2.p1 TRINITY_DN754_c0_g1~~TRINITY_DN754_c0_g1_i2.p1  ORF type:complete len:252 (+),score=58.68 TRINITY_DN754_c0_g1_i2:134-889(+)
MTVAVELQVASLNDGSISMESYQGGELVPMITMNFGLSLKIPVAKLIGEMVDFQKKYEGGMIATAAPVAASRPAEQSTAAVGNGAGGAPQRPLPASAPAHDTPAAATAAPVPPPPPPLPAANRLEVTWETSIEELQPNHDEYLRKVAWQPLPNREPVRLVRESLLNFEPVELQPPKLVYKDRRSPGGADTGEADGVVEPPTPPPGLATAPSGTSPLDLGSAAGNASGQGPDTAVGATPGSGGSDKEECKQQ